jgi:hypothetical protein
MFTKQNKTESMIDAELRDALVKLNKIDKTAAEYGHLVKNICELHKLKAAEKPQRISPDNALLVAANVFGIVAIIHHERVGALTSKAMGFVLKPR